MRSSWNTGQETMAPWNDVAWEAPQRSAASMGRVRRPRCSKPHPSKPPPFIPSQHPSGLRGKRFPPESHLQPFPTSPGGFRRRRPLGAAIPGGKLLPFRPPGYGRCSGCCGRRWPPLQLFQVGSGAGGTSSPRNLTWASTNSPSSCSSHPSGLRHPEPDKPGRCWKTTGIPSAPC